MAVPTCKFSDSGDCKGQLWTCRVCDEQFCEEHSHDTSDGRNVKCAECEYNDADFERDYGQKR